MQQSTLLDGLAICLHGSSLLLAGLGLLLIGPNSLPNTCGDCRPDIETKGGPGAPAHRLGCSHIRAIHHHPDCTPDPSRACAHFRVHSKILPRLLPLPVLHPAPGTHDQVRVPLACWKTFRVLTLFALARRLTLDM